MVDVSRKIDFGEIVEKPKKPKRPPRTFKEKLWVKEYLATKGNGTLAAAKVYDVKNLKTASVIGAENLAKLCIGDILDKVGATDEHIAKTVNEGMDATKPISVVSGKDASEASMDFIDVPDTANRLKAAELAGKLKGYFKDTQTVDFGDKFMNLVVVKSPKKINS